MYGMLRLHGKIHCRNKIKGLPLASQCPFSIHPTMEKVQPCLHEAKKKLSPYQSLVQFLAVLQPAGSAVSSTQARLGACWKFTWILAARLLGPHVALERKYMNKQGEHVLPGERENESLLG